LDKHSFPNGKRLVRDTLKPDDNLHYEKFSDGIVKCIEDEIPFDVPNNWEWVRIKTACVINPRNSIDDNTEVSFVPMANIKEGYANKFISDIRVWKKVKKGYTHFANNDIGIAKITPCFENKKSVVFSSLINGYGAGTTELYILRTISSLVIPEYLLNFVKRDDFIAGGVLTFSGDVGQQRVTKDYVANYLFTLPPLNEQQRILNAVHTATSLIESIEKANDNLIRDIDKTKAKILDLAIRGKLVPQDSNDEPASVLLERIRAEKEELIKQGKIKRDKKESVIFKGDDNSYYQDLPETWELVNFKDCATLISGRDLNKNEYNAESIGIPYITGASNFINENILINRWTTVPKIVSEVNDILITCKGTVGELAINKYGNIHIARQIMAIRIYKNINLEYIKFFLESIVMEIKKTANGLIPGISRDDILSLNIPLPPLAEQKRIVDEIEKIFATLDDIANQVA
jgi:restriction endonuclease S subunit